MPNKKIRVAINGFGRIGRAVFKIALNNPKIEVVALNDLTDNETLAHLLKYDSVYGRYNKKVSSDTKNLYVGNKKYPVYEIADPAKLPWKKLKVDVVIESTGRFVKDEAFKAHLKAGAKKVILSAPAKGKGEVPTCLLGVTENNFKGDVFSNASCTTNSIAPVTSVVDKKFGIEKAFLTTIHSYTADQNIVDGPHKDLRRARAAAHNIVPTTTGATVAVTKIMSQLEGKFEGMAVRVPTICGSLSDLTFIVNKETTAQEVNKVLKAASKSKELKGIMAFEQDPIVSSDILGRTESAIVDSLSTQVIGGNMIKILSWYDNEWGYSNRMVEMIELVVK